MRSIMLCTLTALSLAAFSGCEKTTVEGTAGKKLTLTKPASVTVERGSTEKVTVKIDRENVTEAVTVRFADLPAGVKVEDNGRKIEGSEATFVLEAADDAGLVSNHMVKVTIDGPEGLSVAESFAVTVEEKG